MIIMIIKYNNEHNNNHNNNNNNNNKHNNILTREKLLQLIYNRYFNEESTVALNTFATNITVSKLTSLPKYALQKPQK